MQAFQLCVIDVACREVAQPGDPQLGELAQVTEAFCHHSRTVCKHMQTGTVTTSYWVSFDVSLICARHVPVHILQLVPIHSLIP